MRANGAAVPAIILLFTAVAASRPVVRPSPHSSAFSAQENARLTVHFDSVLAELAARDVSDLSVEQIAARRRHIERLREYRDGGTFPHNHVAAHATPVFVDEHRTHCAMGYLIARDGRSDLVERIRDGRNLARIPELASDTPLVAWVRDAGLTLEEAARIQPAYDPHPDPDPVEPELQPEFAIGSLAYAGVASAVALRNLSRPGRPSLYNAGALLGFAGMAIALGGEQRNSAAKVIAAGDAAIAITSFVIAARSASRRATPVARGQSYRPERTIIATPIFTERTAGIAARIRF